MTSVKHEDGPQPFLAYVRTRGLLWSLARVKDGSLEWWTSDGWEAGDFSQQTGVFLSLASARAYANERGWE